MVVIFASCKGADTAELATTKICRYLGLDNEAVGAVVRQRNTRVANFVVQFLDAVCIDGIDALVITTYGTPWADCVAVMH